MDESGETERVGGPNAGARQRATFLEDAIERWGDTVLRLATSRLHDTTDAEDVFQIVFLRLFQSEVHFHDDEHLKAWLLRVTINCCNDSHRSPWRRRRVALEDATMTNFVAQPASKSDIKLEAALSRLSQRQRTAVHLHYFEGYATDEIAQITGERPATVRSHLFRARKALKLDLGAHS